MESPWSLRHVIQQRCLLCPSPSSQRARKKTDDRDGARRFPPARPPPRPPHWARNAVTGGTALLSTRTRDRPGPCSRAGRASCLQTQAPEVVRAFGPPPADHSSSATGPLLPAHPTALGPGASGALPNPVSDPSLGFPIIAWPTATRRTTVTPLPRPCGHHTDN